MTRNNLKVFVVSWYQQT